MIERIFVANTAEAFEELLKIGASTERGKTQIGHELSLSQRAFFWGADNKAVIVPYQIPQALMDHNMRACEYSDIVSLSPAVPEINLSNAILRDDNLMRCIIDATHGKMLKLSPYAVTDSLMMLMYGLTQRGAKIVLEENPDPSAFWTVKYLDSKVGFRSEMQKLMAGCDDILLPEGFVADSKSQAVDMAEWFYSQGKSAILKANYGESGWGLMMLDAKQYVSVMALRECIKMSLVVDPIWEDTLIVVEELITPNVEIAGGSRSSELYVDASGATVTYHCGQLLDANGGFIGVEIGKNTVPVSLLDKLEGISAVIGSRYHQMGYRGYFDIDFIVGKDECLYVVETNTRRTGGTHTYDLARHLFGKTWASDAYLLSYDSFRYGGEVLNAERLLERLQLVLYPIKYQRKGVIITFINPWDPVLGYIIVAEDRKEALYFQRQLSGLFKDD